MENETEKPYKCAHCDKEFLESEKESSGTNEGIVCVDCLHENYSFCEESNEYFLNDEIIQAYTYVNGRKTEIYVHENLDTYVKCEDGEYWHRDCTYEAQSNRGRTITISRYMYEDGDYFTCDCCSEIFHVDNSYSNDNGMYCGSCYEEESDSNNCDLIHSYSFTPVLKFQGKATLKRPYIGTELEVESEGHSKSDQCENLMEIMASNEFYLKEDGSLTDGFEIVSHPMTLEEHQKRPYEKAFKQLIKDGCKSHDVSTCGLHFHLDKRKMTDAHKVRFGAFFALCKDQIVILARRSSSGYSVFKSKQNDHLEYKHNSSRYEAVNWQPAHTVEIRCFKGTLKAETFLASMEFCAAVFEFTHNKHSFNCNYETVQIWSRFERFLHKLPNDYLNLKKYLELKDSKIKQSLKGQ